MIPKTGSFTKKHRIKTRFEYQTVFDNGLFFYNKIIKVGLLANQRPYSRLGLIVSKQHGSAPKRNKIKRLFREVFRQYRTCLIFSVDVLIIPKFSVKLWDFKTCQEALLDIFKRYNDSLAVH